MEGVQRPDQIVWLPCLDGREGLLPLPQREVRGVGLGRLEDAEGELQLGQGRVGGRPPRPGAAPRARPGYALGADQTRFGPHMSLQEKRAPSLGSFFS